MKVCYLRGVGLKSKNESLGDDDCESLEHIIPNALGGAIKSEDILSHKANQDLNDLIDKNFTRTFESFSVRLGIEKDRVTSPPNIRAFHLEYQKDVVLRNGKYCARRPFYDQEKKIIYASQEAGENYKKHLLKLGKITHIDEVRVVDDISGEIRIPFSLSNDVFKKGIAKIAAGFAAFNGVSRENLRDVINLHEKRFRDDIIVSPFVPSTPAEFLFEHTIAKSPHYPAHVLMLHGSKNFRFLYCYVELFSAFQWYVLLDQDYGGEDIHKSYAYDLMNSVEISCESYISSAPKTRAVTKQLEEYKRITPQKFIALSHVGRDQLRNYNHLKFNALSAFVNYVSIVRKSEELGLDIFGEKSNS